MEYTEITLRFPLIHCFSVSHSRTFPVVARQPLRHPICGLAYFPKLATSRGAHQYWPVSGREQASSLLQIRSKWMNPALNNWEVAPPAPLGFPRQLTCRKWPRLAPYRFDWWGSGGHYVPFVWMKGPREGLELTQELAAAGKDSELWTSVLYRSRRGRIGGDGSDFACMGPIVASWVTAAAGGNREPALDSLPPVLCSHFSFSA